MRRWETEGRSLVIEKRGTPRAVLLSIRDYARLAVPEPECFESSGRNPSKSAETGSAHDTNVLIPAAIKPSGLQRTVVLLALTKPARWYVSDVILSEYGSGSGRSQVGDSQGLRHQPLQLIKNRTHTIAPSHLPVVTVDPADNIFVECADAPRADYLITGDQRHFPEFRKSTKIIISREFLNIVGPHLTGSS